MADRMLPAREYVGAGRGFFATMPKNYMCPVISNPVFSLGVGGYVYRQVTGDSGPGAHLGPFEGQVVAVGPLLGYGGHPMGLFASARHVGGAYYNPGLCVVCL
jgi:hypothetical protein